MTMLTKGRARNVVGKRRVGKGGGVQKGEGNSGSDLSNRSSGWG